MKLLSPGIWVDKINHATITVNENANTISVQFEGGKVFVSRYDHTPTMTDFEKIKEHVIESAEVFEILKPAEDDDVR